jgi:hypothetical protein
MCLSGGPVNNYEWLAAQKPNALHLERNGENACNYRTAREWIEEDNPEWFADTPPALLEEMKATDTIWSLQIYPDTPVGFLKWYGPTLDSVIERARSHFEAKCPVCDWERGFHSPMCSQVRP